MRKCCYAHGTLGISSHRYIHDGALGLAADAPLVPDAVPLPVAIGPRDRDTHCESGARSKGSKRIEAEELDFVLEQAIEPRPGDAERGGKLALGERRA